MPCFHLRLFHANPFVLLVVLCLPCFHLLCLIPTPFCVPGMLSCLLVTLSRQGGDTFNLVPTTITTFSTVASTITATMFPLPLVLLGRRDRYYEGPIHSEITCYNLATLRVLSFASLLFVCNVFIFVCIMPTPSCNYRWCLNQTPHRMPRCLLAQPQLLSGTTLACRYVALSNPPPPNLLCAIEQMRAVSRRCT